MIDIYANSLCRIDVSVARQGCYLRNLSIIMPPWPHDGGNEGSGRCDGGCGSDGSGSGGGVGSGGGGCGVAPRASTAARRPATVINIRGSDGLGDPDGSVAAIASDRCWLHGEHSGRDEKRDENPTHDGGGCELFMRQK